MNSEESRQPEAQPEPPKAPPVKNRKAEKVFVRATKMAICEFPDGERVVIEKGRIGRIAADRVDVLGDLVEKASQAEFAAQEKA